MTSFTLWIRLKDNTAIAKCIQQLGETYNSDKNYKDFPAHITLVPSISNNNPNMEQDEIIKLVESNLKSVREDLGKGKFASFKLTHIDRFINIRTVKINFNIAYKLYLKFLQNTEIN